MVLESETEDLADSTRSTTNTQVENVDESDIVKVDDRYIYYIAERKLVIIDARKFSKFRKNCRDKL